jgi:hypothetical protein
VTTPLTVTGERVLSDSSLAYLFAGLFIPRAAEGQKGMTSYASGHVVPTDQLAVNLPVIALWSLVRQGHATLHPYEEKRLRLFTSKGVRVALERAGEAPGLEGALLALLARAGKPERGEDFAGLVTSLIPRSESPFATMVGRVINEVLDKGYLTKQEVQRGVSDRLRGKPTFTYAAVPAAYEPLRPRAEDLAEQWSKLPADVYSQLRSIAKGAIESRTKRDSDDDYTDS